MTLSINAEVIVIASVFFSLTFSVISAIMAGYAIIRIIAMEKSTHTLQYVPVQQNDEWSKEIDQLNLGIKQAREELQEDEVLF